MCGPRRLRTEPRLFQWPPAACFPLRTGVSCFFWTPVLRGKQVKSRSRLDAPGVKRGKERDRIAIGVVLWGGAVLARSLRVERPERRACFLSAAGGGSEPMRATEGRWGGFKQCRARKRSRPMQSQARLTRSQQLLWPVSAFAQCSSEGIAQLLGRQRASRSSHVDRNRTKRAGLHHLAFKQNIEPRQRKSHVAVPGCVEGRVVPQHFRSRRSARRRGRPVHESMIELRASVMAVTACSLCRFQAAKRGSVDKASFGNHSSGLFCR